LAKPEIKLVLKLEHWCF